RTGGCRRAPGAGRRRLRDREGSRMSDLPPEVPAGVPPLSPDGRRSAVIALVGAPNAGKSTLLNRAVGAKVSIVTHKVQTTRTRIRGIAMLGDTQLVFVDTPGIFVGAKRRLERAMVATAWRAVADADLDRQSVG